MLDHTFCYSNVAWELGMMRGSLGFWGLGIDFFT
jgi:hypothetical protein